MSEPIPAPDELRRLHQSFNATRTSWSAETAMAEGAVWSEQEAVAVALAV